MKFLQLQARDNPFFVTHASILTWDIFLIYYTTPRLNLGALYNFKKIISKITQRSATPYIICLLYYNLLKQYIYGQGFGILFRSVKFSVLLTLTLYMLLYMVMYKPVLCYEVFKKWPLLSLFPGCIRKKLPYFHLTIILEP